MRWHRLLHLATAAGVIVLATPLCAQDTTRGTVRGVALADEGGERIAYALVELVPGHAPRFSDEAGGFFFASVAPGTYRLIVRQVGYAPKDTELVVGPATPALRIELRHLPVQVAAFVITADAECLAPGPPASTDSALSTVFDQLRQNADRFRLLSDQYPYRYTLVRRLGDQLRDGDERVRMDTMDIRSDTRWPYRPGRVVIDDPVLYRIDGSRLVRLPTLADFADSSFLRTHCFRLSGLDSSQGPPYLRLDFRAAKSLRSADIDGSVFLDPRTYQVRHTSLSLTRVSDVARGVVSYSAMASFKEVVPNIIVIERVYGFTTLDARPGARSIVARLEMQQLVGVRFVRALPASSDSAGRP